MEYTDVLTNIRKIIRTINLESKRIEKEYGISIPQLLCLNYLSTKQNFQASHKELKDFLSLNASTVTGIITRLERKGLVAKLPKRADRRISYITITAKGADLIENTPVLLHEQITQKLHTLSNAELQELKRAFKILVEFLDLDQSLDASPIITGDVHIRHEQDNNSEN